jgi:hypothetical protein
MKTLLAAILLAFSTVALAHQPRMYQVQHYHQHLRNQDWIAPAVLGAVIGYGISQSQRPAAPPVNHPQVIVHQPREVIVVTEPACTVWRETQYPDGTVVRERICR